MFKNMNKMLFLSIMSISLLSACAPRIQLEGSYWVFGDGLGSKLYYENRWDCFYKQSDNQFYVECFLEDGNKMDSFYTDRVRYVEE